MARKGKGKGRGKPKGPPPGSQYRSQAEEPQYEYSADHGGADPSAAEEEHRANLQQVALAGIMKEAKGWTNKERMAARELLDSNAFMAVATARYVLNCSVETVPLGRRGNEIAVLKWIVPVLAAHAILTVVTSSQFATMYFDTFTFFVYNLYTLFLVLYGVTSLYPSRFTYFLMNYVLPAVMFSQWFLWGTVFSAEHSASNLSSEGYGVPGSGNWRLIYLPCTCTFLIVVLDLRSLAMWWHSHGWTKETTSPVGEIQPGEPPRTISQRLWILMLWYWKSLKTGGVLWHCLKTWSVGITPLLFWHVVYNAEVREAEDYPIFPTSFTRNGVWWSLYNLLVMIVITFLFTFFQYGNADQLADDVKWEEGKKYQVGWAGKKRWETDGSDRRPAFVLYYSRWFNGVHKLLGRDKG